MAVVIFVYSGDVDNILTDILNKYHPDSEQPEAQTLREFVDNLQESKLSTKSNGFYFHLKVKNAVAGQTRTISPETNF